MPSSSNEFGSNNKASRARAYNLPLSFCRRARSPAPMACFWARTFNNSSPCSFIRLGEIADPAKQFDTSAAQALPGQQAPSQQEGQTAQWGDGPQHAHTPQREHVETSREE